MSSIKPATMNDLPVPQGSWKQSHAANQREYNIILALGVTIFSSTLTYVSIEI